MRMAEVAQSLQASAQTWAALPSRAAVIARALALDKPVRVTGPFLRISNQGLPSPLAGPAVQLPQTAPAATHAWSTAAVGQ